MWKSFVISVPEWLAQENCLAESLLVTFKEGTRDRGSYEGVGACGRMHIAVGRTLPRNTSPYSTT